MADDAVIIDDGGSTRIKQLKGTATGRMDELLEPGNSDNAHGAFGNLRIQYLDKNGVPGAAIVDPALGSPCTITISSANNQTVIADIGNMSKLTVTLSSGSAGVEPLVHSKQNGPQRRYVVSNAGSIQKVEVKKGAAAATKIYDILDNTRPESASVYTMIVLK